jgi:hypothetical protein
MEAPWTQWIQLVLWCSGVERRNPNWVLPRFRWHSRGARIDVLSIVYCRGNFQVEISDPNAEMEAYRTTKRSPWTEWYSYVLRCWCRIIWYWKRRQYMNGFAKPALFDLIHLCIRQSDISQVLKDGRYCIMPCLWFNCPIQSCLLEGRMMQLH